MCERCDEIASALRATGNNFNVDYGSNCKDRDKTHAELYPNLTKYIAKIKAEKAKERKTMTTLDYIRDLIEIAGTENVSFSNGLIHVSATLEAAHDKETGDPLNQPLSELTDFTLVLNKLNSFLTANTTDTFREQTGTFAFEIDRETHTAFFQIRIPLGALL